LKTGEPNPNLYILILFSYESKCRQYGAYMRQMEISRNEWDIESVVTAITLTLVENPTPSREPYPNPSRES
jgi:hypothetical protein